MQHIFFWFQFPQQEWIAEYLEPMVLGTIIVPDDYIGDLLSLFMVRLFQFVMHVVNVMDDHSPDDYIRDLLSLFMVRLFQFVMHVNVMDNHSPRRLHRGSTVSFYGKTLSVCYACCQCYGQS